MSVIHLSTRVESLCGRSVWSDNGTGDLNRVTCKFCTRRFAVVVKDEVDALFQRRWTARAAANCEAVGLGSAWETLSAQGDDLAAVCMAREILASLAQFLVELKASPEASVAQIGGAA